MDKSAFLTGCQVGVCGSTAFVEAYLGAPTFAAIFVLVAAWLYRREQRRPEQS